MRNIRPSSAVLVCCLIIAQGAHAGVLNVTLQLTTADLLPVSAVLQAASLVWDVEDKDIRVVSATAKKANMDRAMPAHSRTLLQRRVKVHLDFAKMKEENPNLLTLKDFLMSSNQAPETENDIQQLLQAFADFKQGEVDAMSLPQSASKPSTPQDAGQAAVASSQTVTSAALHPHLLFLKTGGGSTVAEPKHQLSMEQLQSLADGGSTSEGLLPVQRQMHHVPLKPVASSQQSQGPLGTAKVVLGTQDEASQQLASLFTPQNDKAIAKALRILEQNDKQHANPALFSSLVADPEDDFLRSLHMPTGALDESLRDLPTLFSQAKNVLPDVAIDPMKSLKWLDESERYTADGAQPSAGETGLKGSSSPGDSPALSRAVLLSILLSIATSNATALQATIGESIASRQLQQQLGRQGYVMGQLDAMFASEGVFSTETEVVSAETADPSQALTVEQVKVSVRTVVKRHIVSDPTAAKQGSDMAEEVFTTDDTDESSEEDDDDWEFELLICIAGLAAALTAVILGIYTYSRSRAGKQAQQYLAATNRSSLWLCGSNPLRQPLIPRHAAAEDAC